jgi:hypothetical protein
MVKDERSIEAIISSRAYLQLAHSQWHREEISSKLVPQCDCDIASLWREIGKELSEPQGEDLDE